MKGKASGRPSHVPSEHRAPLCILGMALPAPVRTLSGAQETGSTHWTVTALGVTGQHHLEPPTCHHTPSLGAQADRLAGTTVHDQDVGALLA